MPRGRRRLIKRHRLGAPQGSLGAHRDTVLQRRPDPRARLLDAWLHAAARSKLPPFVMLGCTLREHKDAMLNAIRLGLSNSRLEGLANRIRLISRRGFGFHTADQLIAF